ncbi:hypothetical protein PGT21_003669 [Puccinia graminis f. sp. tritici]|uniref:Uncharacterized protein n=1 Tax=Puccinia graminis f. sp. tritici TaxID=56615 RepID=A0A5B0M8V5_PUCGR|nr:hypothetical protein PGT21_003669 [Puccinia graminis f. sp. tritici]
MRPFLKSNPPKEAQPGSGFDGTQVRCSRFVGNRHSVKRLSPSSVQLGAGAALTTCPNVSSSTS